MKLLTCLVVGLLVASSLAAAWNEQPQQHQKRILRRVIKSTPTATNLARVRLVTVRAADSNEKGVVSEISSKDAASFGQRSSNETSTQKTTSAAASAAAATKTKSSPSETAVPQTNPSKAPVATKTATSTSTTSSPTTTTNAPNTSSTTNTTSTTSAPTPSPSSTPETASPKSKASERQQAAPEVELMSSAQSSWQMMSAVEAPVAALISAGTRPAAKTVAANELATSSTGEFSRTYSSFRQQTGKTRQQQATFYSPPPPPQPQPQPQPQQLRQGKTSTYQATKSQWYQPTTSTTTARPAPILQEPQYEQYVEQQVDSAPPGQAEPFAFDFNTQDTSGNGQYRKEESDSNGVVRGSYGFRDASGLYRHVDYVADHNGFRASIRSNEPGLEGGRDSQPASIKLDSGPAPARFTSSNNADWTATSFPGLERADLASTDPDFESSHKSERIRVNFRD